jgi:hypothetical protein
MRGGQVKRVTRIGLSLVVLSALAAVVVPKDKWEAFWMEVSSNHWVKWKRNVNRQLVATGDLAPDQSYKPLTPAARPDVGHIILEGWDGGSSDICPKITGLFFKEGHGPLISDCLPAGSSGVICGSLGGRERCSRDPVQTSAAIEPGHYKVHVYYWGSGSYLFALGRSQAESASPAEPPFLAMDVTVSAGETITLKPSVQSILIRWPQSPSRDLRSWVAEVYAPQGIIGRVALVSYPLREVRWEPVAPGPYEVRFRSIGSDTTSVNLTLSNKFVFAGETIIRNVSVGAGQTANAEWK